MLQTSGKLAFTTHSVISPLPPPHPDNSSHRILHIEAKTPHFARLKDLFVLFVASDVYVCKRSWCIIEIFNKVEIP